MRHVASTSSSVILHALCRMRRVRRRHLMSMVLLRRCLMHTNWRSVTLLHVLLLCWNGSWMPHWRTLLPSWSSTRRNRAVDGCGPPSDHVRRGNMGMSCSMRCLLCFRRCRAHCGLPIVRISRSDHTSSPRRADPSARSSVRWRRSHAAVSWWSLSTCPCCGAFTIGCGALRRPSGCPRFGP